jgi:hypothetical protein
MPTILEQVSVHVPDYLEAGVPSHKPPTGHRAHVEPMIWGYDLLETFIRFDLVGGNKPI